MISNRNILRILTAAKQRCRVAILGT